MAHANGRAEQPDDGSTTRHRLPQSLKQITATATTRRVATAEPLSNT
jgi:hypothetical protein